MKRLKENLLEIVTVTVCLIVLCIFVSMKQGFHMDELLSFQLSNAKYNPWIVTTQPEGRLAKFVRNEIEGVTLGETIGNLAAEVKDVLQNRGNSKLLTYKADVYEEPVWITAQQFRDYIQVDGRDAFRYPSVYFNVKDDNHPPLHFMLLHTVSSLFQGKAEAWMGCLINLVAVAFILIYMIKIGRLLAQETGCSAISRQTGVMAALIYGLSTGAVATTLLIRMYGMVTLWCVLYFYLVIKKWKDGDFAHSNKCLILVTVLGFWTQYFFLFYCILLAVTVGILLFVNKRKKELFCFIRSMLIAAVIGIVIFPFAISDVFSSGRGVEALGNLMSGLAGYGYRLWEFLKIVSGRTLLLWFWIGLALLAIVRKIKVKTTEKAQGSGAYFCMLFVPVVGYFLLAARMSPYLVDRYVMPIFPFVILAGIVLLALLQRGLTSVLLKKFSVGVCLAMVLLQLGALITYDGSYLYRGYTRQEAVAEEYSGYACICVYEGVGYYENLKEFTYYEKTLLVTPKELENRKESHSIEALDKVALLIKCDEVDSEAAVEIMKNYGFSVESWGWDGLGVHGDRLCFMSRD